MRDLDEPDLEIVWLLIADSDGTAFARTCARCGNTVDGERTTTRIDGEWYRFCGPSREARFEENHERLREGADRSEGLAPRCFVFEAFEPRVLNTRKGKSIE